jgi:hypothetical protein
MEELHKKVRQTIRNRPYPDYSHVEPPKEHAVYAMLKNLQAAAKKQ